MKIAFDLHGTIDHNPSAMRALIGELLADGHEVAVMSGGEVDEIKATMSYIGLSDVVDRVEILSVVVWCRDTMKIPGGVKISPRSGVEGWYCADEIWWASKAMMCNAFAVDYLVDDKPEYAEYFGNAHRTSFLAYTKKQMSAASIMHRLRMLL